MRESPSLDSIFDQPVAQRAAELSRIRLIAFLLFLAMTGLFIATSVLSQEWPLLDYPRAFAGAAMVGALADWFAVVALFRHPLGLPIPHTAIVPRHKDRIGTAIGRFVSANFLAPSEVNRRLAQIDVAGWMAGWLKDAKNAKLAAQRSHSLLSPVLELLREERVHAFSRDVIRRGIESIAAAPFAARVLSVLSAQGYHDTLFDQALAEARSFLLKHRTAIRRKVAGNSISWLPEWVDAKLTDAFLASLLDTLANVRAPENPMRVEYKAALKRLIVRLASDQELFDRGERIKDDVLNNAAVESYLGWLTSEIEEKIKNEQTSPDGLFASGLEHALLALGHWIDIDEHLRVTINTWMRELVSITVTPNRDEIGAFVADVVARWDTETFVEKLELQVGKDLQYIRINGTLVGGLVGLIIFMLSGWL